MNRWDLRFASGDERHRHKVVLCRNPGGKEPQCRSNEERTQNAQFRTIVMRVPFVVQTGLAGVELVDLLGMRRRVDGTGQTLWCLVQTELSESH